MPMFETLAVVITAETYSLAVASLPPAFATIPFDQVDGHILVLNDLSVKTTKKGPKLVVGNGWMSQRDFTAGYGAANPNPDIMFTFSKVNPI